MPPIAVIGVGNTLMGDDGVGYMIAEELQGRHAAPGAPAVAVIPSPTAGMGLMRYFRHCPHVIVVDALHTQGAAPGDIFRFDPDEAGITATRSHNTHGMGVAYLVTNARLLGAQPHVIVYGIQVGDVRQNDRTLTEPVGRAARRVRELIRSDIDRMLADPAPPACRGEEAAPERQGNTGRA